MLSPETRIGNLPRIGEMRLVPETASQQLRLGHTANRPGALPSGKRGEAQLNLTFSSTGLSPYKLCRCEPVRLVSVAVQQLC